MYTVKISSKDLQKLRVQTLHPPAYFTPLLSHMKHLVPAAWRVALATGVPQSLPGPFCREGAVNEGDLEGPRAHCS